MSGLKTAIFNLILPAGAKIILYENNPSLGIRWEKALSNGFKINPNGETLIAEPYFFLPKNINSSGLVFNWFVNGEKTSAPDFKNILSVRPEAGQSGNALIKVIVDNVNTLFQNAEKE